MDVRVEHTAQEQFGQLLRTLRRRAGLTQAQLGREVGYHASLISKLESGERAPSSALTRRLDEMLHSDGRLASAAFGASATPAPQAPSPPQHPLSVLLFSIPPLPDPPTVAVADVLRSWPVRLPSAGVACPMHRAATCAVPPVGFALTTIVAIRSRRDSAASFAADHDVIHGIAGLLASLAESSALTVTMPMLHSVEHVLRTLVVWSGDIYRAGGHVQVPLQLAAGYAQLAGRMRMLLGYSALAMSWLEHSITWSRATEDVVTLASVYSDVCTLVRIENDGATSLGYARALAALDPHRSWMSSLGHAYAARGCAFSGDTRAVDHEIDAARRRLDQMDERDELEAPWMQADHGALRVESAAAGALRDLAALTGDHAAARRAVHASKRSLALLPARRLSTRLLLTTRLADSYVCAGEPEAAVTVMEPVLAASSSVTRSTLMLELAGLRRNLRPWRSLPDVADLDKRLDVLCS